MTHSATITDDKSIEQTVLPTFDAKEYRRALGSFPTGVAIITARDANGEPIGLTCNSFSSVSLEPPLVLWSMRKASKSIEHFRDTPSFAINVLAEDQDHLSQRFATSSIEKKFENVAWTPGSMDLPLIDHCVARFQCTTYAKHDAGDHIIFIGRVEQFEVVREDNSLVFYKGAYMMLAQSLRIMAQKGTITHHQLAQARLLIYGMLLKLACENGAESDFVAIEKNLSHMDELVAAGNMTGRMSAAIEFFDLISAAGRNEVMSLIAQSLNSLLQHTVKAAVEKNDAKRVYVPQLDVIRWKILGALRARDPASAVSAMNTYIDHATHVSN